MSAQCKLVTLMFALALHGQVDTGKIIGGHKAVPHSRPYMVLLEMHMQDNRPRYCGGFLLNDEFVMTAAHCQAKSFKVHLGVHNFNEKTNVQSMSVKQYFPHEDYNESDYSNDIMLLKLSSKAKLTKNVRPIPLADQADSSLPRSCIVSGWGKTNRNEHYMSLELMEVYVTLIDEEQCAKGHLYCSKGETGPAEGDSGGPLVCEDGKAYGVVSTSRRGNKGDTQISTYVKIPDYREWIDSTMKKWNMEYLTVCKTQPN